MLDRLALGCSPWPSLVWCFWGALPLLFSGYGGAKITTLSQPFSGWPVRVLYQLSHSRWSKQSGTLAIQSEVAIETLERDS